MGSAKELRVGPISSANARSVIAKHHYSGRGLSNSQVHLGVFWKGRCEGAMQFGPPMDKRKVLPLVRGTAWPGMLELNRMAFGPRLPRNSESRAIGVAMRLLRKTYPKLEWILSFADATQCGDGTIYRASGFVLTGIRRNKTLLQMPDGSIVADKTLNDRIGPGGLRGAAMARAAGAKALPGFQLRYIYFLNPKARARLTVPELPFEAIAEAGAGMYRGESR